MTYKLVIEYDYFGPLSTLQKTHSKEFAVNLDTMHGPKFEDYDAFWEYHHPGTNDVGMSDVDWQTFSDLYDNDQIVSMHYEETN